MYASERMVEKAMKSLVAGERYYERGPLTYSKVCDGISRESVCGSMMKTRAHDLRASGRPKTTGECEMF